MAIKLITRLKLTEDVARRALIDPQRVAGFAYIAPKLDKLDPETVRADLVIYRANVIRWQIAGHGPRDPWGPLGYYRKRAVSVADHESNKVRILWLCALVYISRIDAERVLEEYTA